MLSLGRNAICCSRASLSSFHRNCGSNGSRRNRRLFACLLARTRDTAVPADRPHYSALLVLRASSRLGGGQTMKWPTGSKALMLLEVPPRSATCGMPTAARRLWTQEHADSEVGGVSAQVMIRGPEGRGVVVHYCQGQITDPLCRCRVGINRYAPMHQRRTTTPPPLHTPGSNLGFVACACTACVQTR